MSVKSIYWDFTISRKEKLKKLESLLPKLYKLKAGTAKTAYTFVSGFCLLRPGSTIRIYSVNAFLISVIHQICENLYLPFSPDCTTLLFVIYTFYRLL